MQPGAHNLSPVAYFPPPAPFFLLLFRVKSAIIHREKTTVIEALNSWSEQSLISLESGFFVEHKE